jgi:hypothetical protein
MVSRSERETGSRLTESQTQMEVEMSGNFRITGGKGFHVTLPNGWIVSTQFGPGNYGDHYDCRIGGDQCYMGKRGQTCGEVGSVRVEVAAWHRDHPSEMLELENGDSVDGYLTNEKWWAFMQMIAAKTA